MRLLNAKDANEIAIKSLIKKNIKIKEVMSFIKEASLRGDLSISYAGMSNVMIRILRNLGYCVTTPDTRTTLVQKISWGIEEKD
jgi:hypothetical protein